MATHASEHEPRPQASSARLPVGRYRARLRAVDTVRLPAYSGSAWRGAFGHALKRLVCVTRLDECKGCLLYRSCPYSYVFETPPPLAADRMRTYPAAPHPFVLDLLEHPEIVEAGECYRLGFTLFGRGNAQLAYFVAALERAARAGIGPGRGRLALDAVEQEREPGSGRWHDIYLPGAPLDPLAPACPEPGAPPTAGVRVVLETPLRLKAESEPARPSAFRFGTFYSHLLRRVSMLAYFHTGEALEMDFAAAVREARAVPLAGAKLAWHDMQRHSARQNRQVPLGGLTGSFELAPQELAPFWLMLWLGRFTHVGAATSMGLGAYRLEPAGLPDAPHDAPPRHYPRP